MRRLGRADHQPRETRAGPAPLGGRDEQVLARRHGLAEPARDLGVVLGLAPGALDFGLEAGRRVFDEQRARGHQLEQRAAHFRRVLERGVRIDGENRHAAECARAALGPEIERAQLGELLAPERGARRQRHAEPVHVHDAAAHRVLRDVGDLGDLLIAELLQPPDGTLERGAGTNLEARGRERGRHQRALETRARGRDDHLHRALRHRLQRFGALARDLDVRLLVAQAFALGIEEGASLGQEQRQVGEPALRLDRPGRNHDHALAGLGLDERGDEHRAG